MSRNNSGSRKLLTRLAVLSALACVAAGAISASYAVSPVVIDQGGGRATGSAYAVVASIGGPAIATSSSANYTVNANITLAAGPMTPPVPDPTTPPVDSGFSFTGGGCAPLGQGASPLAFAGLAGMVFLAVCRMRRRVAG